MGDPERQSALFPRPKPQDAAVQINDRCVIRTQDEHHVVVVSGVALAQYTVGDRMAEAHAMVSLVEQGWADQNDVAQAFGCSARTVRRHQRRFESGGLSALGRPNGYPKGRRRQGQARLKSVLRWKSEGLSNRGVAHRLGVSEKTVRKLLRQAGWVPAEPAQARLPLPESADPNLSAFSAPEELIVDEPLPLSLDIDPADRRLDRLLAYLGLLEDAAPLFRPGLRVPRAGSSWLFPL